MTKTSVQEMRRGWTTGACAAAAARSAYTALIENEFPDPVAITLPGGQRPSFALARHTLRNGVAEAAIIKDAGDDPDVTHGALVVVRVRLLNAGEGVRFRAGEGIGTVTREGLELDVGEPAINPAPRRLIVAEVADVAAAHGVSPDVEVEIAIPGGEQLAKKTLNGRLGIVDGLSVLGTTGVVIPFSCSAWIHSIHRSIDVARAAGIEHAAAATGSTSEVAVKTLYNLPEEALIDMGDFAGGTLKYIRRHPIRRLTVAGGFAKLGKLGAGLLDLHSKRGRIDLNWMAGCAASSGASALLVKDIREAETAGRALQIAKVADFPIGEIVARAARDTALGQVSSATEVEVLIFDRKGVLVGRCDD